MGAVTVHRGRLRILFVTAWYPSAQAPLHGIFVREHAKAARLHHDVTVLHCPGEPAPIAQAWTMERETDASLTEGLPTYRVRHRRSRVPGATYATYLWAVLRASSVAAAAHGRPDLVHAHVYNAALPAVLLGSRYRVPVVVTEHFSGFPRRLLNGTEAWKARIGLGRARMVLPVSRALQEGIQRYGIRARFRVVPNVVDTALFHPAPPREAGAVRRLLFVGLLAPSHVKGVPYLLEAAASLLRRTDWRLDIVGDGPARAEYEALARRLGLDGRITFHGLVDKRRVAQFMREADAFVLPSVWENLPCVVIEALASGLPVVASHVGGIPELIDSRVGVLVPPADPGALARALEDILDARRRFDAQTMRRRAEACSLESVGRMLDEIYREARR